MKPFLRPQEEERLFMEYDLEDILIRGVVLKDVKTKIYGKNS